MELTLISVGPFKEPLISKNITNIYCNKHVEVNSETKHKYKEAAGKRSRSFKQRKSRILIKGR